jgi:hypothetical protein
LRCNILIFIKLATLVFIRLFLWNNIILVLFDKNRELYFKIKDDSENRDHDFGN